ncbi:MAG TPA: glycosyltransferase [Candidatus Woesebacteria bacterium]|nr:glycosyltransferase [Candidatus Woesebacteria bacterium]
MTDFDDHSPYSKLKQARVAVVYDRVNINYGGGEQVVQALGQIFPQAHLFTSVCDHNRAQWTKSFPKIHTSFLNRISWLRTQHRWLLPLMPLAFESLDLSEYDLIISVTSGEAKGIITRADQLHLCYLLSPPKYLYHYQDEYLQSNTLVKLPVFNWLIKQIFKYLLWWDQAATHRPNSIITLSHSISQLASRLYHFPCFPVIYPPLDMINLSTSLNNSELKRLKLPKKYDVIVSRLVFYKRVDLAIQATINLGRNLVIVGDGPQKKKLSKLVKQINRNHQVKIIFLGSQPQNVVNSIIKHATLFLSLGIDDFGLAPIQAFMLGKVTVIHQQSGVAELLSKFNGCQTIASFSSNEIETVIKNASSKSINSANISYIKQHYGYQSFSKQINQFICKRHQSWLNQL